MKNFWRKTGEETDYLGINAVYLVPEEGGGTFPFELQFHTHQSIDTKMQKSHISYEKFRQEHSMAKAQYWEEMVRMLFDACPRHRCDPACKIPEEAASARYAEGEEEAI